MIESKVGPYEITAEVAEGGIGEVHRARDAELERGAAIQVLPSAFTQEAERRN